MSASEAKLNKIARMQARIPNADEYTHEVLDAAKSVALASSPDEVQKAMADAIVAMSLHAAGQSCRVQNVAAEAVAVHEEQMHGDNQAAPTGRFAWLVAVISKPWPWITIAVVAFSPHAPAIIEAIKTTVAR